MPALLLLLVLLASFTAYMLGHAAASRFGATGGRHSTAPYHGSYAAFWVGVPATALVLIWTLLQGSAIDALLIRTLPAPLLASTSDGLVLAEIHDAAAGRSPVPATPEIAAAAGRLVAWQTIAHTALLVMVLATMTLGALIARTCIAPRFRARIAVERALSSLMVACSLVAVLVALGIVASLLSEAVGFFRQVAPHDFFLGRHWEPQIAIRDDQIAGPGAFGALPVFAGTALIAAIAMLVAVPIGLHAAIYLTEYASDRTRRMVAPLLEILAGVPGVVYGFFALVSVAPAVRLAGASLGLPVSPNSALAAGAVTGIMIVPLIVALADDALRAVPSAIRDGSLALGATRAETVMRVLLPAALPGILAGLMLALSRAIGETMIVLMAAGLIATLTLNPLQSVTTVTVEIVATATGDVDFTGTGTKAAFALGSVLLGATLALNLLALRLTRRNSRREDPR
ncbi:MAG: phosphate ABC transporter permease subunit PstC [Amaricoccus sp.]